MKERIPIVERLTNLQSGGILLNETNVEWHKWEHRENAQQLLPNTFGGANVEYSTSKEKIESRVKPGGTLAAAVGDWSHRVKTGHDNTGWGQWSYITLALKEDKFLTLVSAYRVCDQTNPVNTTASAQQYKIQYEDKELRPFLPSPHWQTLIDLEYFFNDLKYANHKVLIFMDANENETHQLQAQTHDVKFVTKRRFRVDGSIDGSLHTFMRNCGLINVIKELNEGTPPNTHNHGSQQIDFVLATARLFQDGIEQAWFLDPSVLGSDHKGMYSDLNTQALIGTGRDHQQKPQFRKLQLDDPRISDAYRKILHQQLVQHNVYHRVKCLSDAPKDVWDLSCEQKYEGVECDVPAAMIHAEKSCSLRKQYLTPWAKSIGVGMNAIRYWDVRVQRRGERHPHHGVLNYYLARSDVDVKTFNKPLPLTECINQANNTRAKSKHTLKNLKDNSTQYEHEVAAAWLERRHPHLADCNSDHALEREDLILKEIKRRENKRVTARSFKKMGRQIRGHVKPYSLKKTSLKRLEVQYATGIWKHTQGKESIEEHIAQRNMEQFSHAGKTPFGYTPLGEELGHTGDTQMAEDILSGTLEHEELRDDAIQAIVKQLRQHPAIQQIIKHIIMVEDFKSIQVRAREDSLLLRRKGVPPLKSMCRRFKRRIGRCKIRCTCRSRVYPITHGMLSGKMETRHRRHARKDTRGGKIQKTGNNPTARGRSESSP
jgi:hypothetical protein